MRKAEILRERLIEDAERMREIDSAFDRDFTPRCRAPRRAREIAESVDRDDGRLIERADMEGRGQMRQMMLDAVELRAQGLARKGLLQKSRQAARERGDCAADGAPD